MRRSRRRAGGCRSRRCRPADHWRPRRLVDPHVMSTTVLAIPALMLEDTVVPANGQTAQFSSVSHRHLRIPAAGYRSASTDAVIVVHPHPRPVAGGQCRRRRRWLVSAVWWARLPGHQRPAGRRGTACATPPISAGMRYPRVRAAHAAAPTRLRGLAKLSGVDDHPRQVHPGGHRWRPRRPAVRRAPRRRRRRNRAPVRIAVAETDRQCIRIHGTPAAATTPAIAGSAQPDTSSLTIAAPLSKAPPGPRVHGVDADRQSLGGNLTTGMTQAISTAHRRGPHRAGWTHRRRRRCRHRRAARRSPCSTAAAGSR